MRTAHVVVAALLQACGSEYYFEGKVVDPINDPDAPITDTELVVTETDPVESDPPVDPVDTDVAVDTEVPVDTEVEEPIESDPPEVVEESDVPEDPPPIESDIPIDTDFIPPLGDLYALDGDLLWPESGSWDPDTNAFYVGSLQFGHVTRMGTAGIQTVWYEHPSTAAGWQTWGVEADPARRKLFVCVRKGSAINAPWSTWVIHLDTGVLLRDIPMGDSRANAQCRDYTVEPTTGMVYVTDRREEVVHLLNPTNGAVSVWAEHSELSTGVGGPDGIAYSAEADVILVARSKPPAIVRIPRNNPAGLVTLPLDVGDFALSAGHELDAIEFWGDDLWVAGTNRLIKVTPNDPALWTDATVTAYNATIGGVSGLTRTDDGRLYSINGDPFALTLGIQPDLPFEIAEVVLPLVLTP